MKKKVALDITKMFIEPSNYHLINDMVKDVETYLHCADMSCFCKKIKPADIVEKYLADRSDFYKGHFLARLRLAAMDCWINRMVEKD